MQSKLIQELYKRTKSLVAATFPDAVLLKPDGTGWRIWELSHGGNLKMFLMLAPSPKDDSFALEIAWTIHGSLPEYNGLNPDEDPGKGEMYFRLSQFWHPYGLEHRWYLGSARGTEEMKSMAIQIPSGFEALSNSPGSPHNKDYLDKLKKLGLDVPAPTIESLEVKLESVGPQVEDAFAKLQQYGVPYLKQIAARYGTELKTKP